MRSGNTSLPSVYMQPRCVNVTYRIAVSLGISSVLRLKRPCRGKRKDLIKLISLRQVQFGKIGWGIRAVLGRMWKQRKGTRRLENWSNHLFHGAFLYLSGWKISIDLMKFERLEILGSLEISVVVVWWVFSVWTSMWIFHRSLFCLVSIVPGRRFHFGANLYYAY